MNIKLLIAVTILLLIGQKKALSGGMDSGGGSTIFAHQGAAWYLGDEPIHYCIQRHQSYPVSIAAIKESISKVINKWKIYYQIKGFSRPQEDEKLPLINFNYQLNENCQGNEDLTFYFGRATEEVEQLKTNYQDPLGFSYSKSFDKKRAWTNGLVWISEGKTANGQSGHHEIDFVNSPVSLDVILLHEVGHIMGIGHVPFTVMQKEIVEVLQTKTIDQDYFQIDWETVLVGSIISIRQESGVLSINKPEAEDLYRKLTGKAPKDEIHVDLTCTKTNLINMGQLKPEDLLPEKYFTLTINSGAENTLFDFYTTFTNISLSPGGEKIFFRFQQSDEFGQMTSSSPDIPLSLYGEIRSQKDGTTYSALLEYRMFSMNNLITMMTAIATGAEIDVRSQFKNTSISIYILEGLNKKQIYGPSAYWSTKI